MAASPGMNFDCAAYFWTVATIAMPSRTSTPDGAEDGLAKRSRTHAAYLETVGDFPLGQIPTKPPTTSKRADWGSRVVASYAKYLLYARYFVVEIL
jgi:hypothetical protein